MSRPSQHGSMPMHKSSSSKTPQELGKHPTGTSAMHRKMVGLAYRKHSSLNENSLAMNQSRILTEARKIDDDIVARERRLQLQLMSQQLGSSTLTEISPVEKVDMAAVLLFDAINNLTTRHRIASSFDRALYLFVHGKMFRATFVTPVCFVHMMLIFIENPSEFSGWEGRKEVAMGMDMCCILFHLLHFCVRLGLRHSGNNSMAEDAALAKVRFSLRKKLMKVRRFFGGRTEQFEMFAFLIAIAMLIENSVYLSEDYGTARFCRCLRVVYLVDAQPLLKRLVRNCLSSLIALREVLLLSAAVILFFSLTAIVVWPPATTAEGATHFYSLHRAIMSFTFASMGAVNFPDIMLPAVNEDFRSTCLFFMCFMVLVVVWLLNLCLATVYQQYRSFLSKRALHQHKTRRKALLSAFILLDIDSDKVIEKDDFLTAVRKVRDLDSDDAKELDFLWNQCDMDKDGTIDPHDFFSVCDILVCTVKKKSRSSYHIVPSPYDGDEVSKEEAQGWNQGRSSLFNRLCYGGLLPQLRAILIQPFFSSLVIGCILGSNVILVYAANAKLSGEEEPVWCEQVEYFFVSVFVVEVIIKMLAVGVNGYINTPWWKFDFFVTIASMLGIALDLQSSASSFQQTSVPLRMSKVLRTIRLIRVVSRVKKFRMIISTSTKFFPAVPRFLLLICSILYIYMVIGIESFSFPTQTQWEHATNNTSYSDMVYEIPSSGADSATYADMSYSKNVNFQTPQNALITLFSLMMVNNWHIIHDAVEVACSSKWGVSFYFVSFHIIAVIVVMNLVVSTFLESYLKEWMKNHLNRQDVLEKTIVLDDGGRGSVVNNTSSNSSDQIITRAIQERTLVCYTCESPFTWKLKSYECSVTRKICCQNCCKLYVEPRLDIAMRSSPKLLANFSNQKVGYEPLRIERETREELLRNWREDAELELSEFVDDSDFDENEGQIELKSQSLRNLKEKTENKGGLGSTFTEMFTHAQSKYFVRQQSQSEHVIVEDLEVKIGLDDNGLEKVKEERTKDGAELEQAASATIDEILKKEKKVRLKTKKSEHGVSFRRGSMGEEREGGRGRGKSLTDRLRESHG
ncbi:hypothetical protein TL16_g02578 [Triparma laevis f. inornata]|uniref:EF-hand domain-containing protein n=1 Tax=Triparma laevis f. inornata TaxID=1714386 RepID=A0A9W6ZP63_9STRA|nr:hypothetical protein TL16_g02578 [Triparma laevis f. inornata]